MPELPEVEIVTQGLKNVIINKKVIEVKLFRNKLRREINESFISDIEGTHILSIRRRSKYIIIDLSNKKSILIHLGMTGRFTIESDLQEVDLKKHSHILIRLSEGLSLVYNDVRRFGLALTMDTKYIAEHSLIRNIGVEPLSEEFDGDKLLEILKGKITNIKTALLNQSLVCF